MKRLLVAVLVLLMALTGCTNAEDDNIKLSLGNNQTPEVSQTGKDKEKQYPSQKPVEDENGLRQLSMNYDDKGCSTESGYYNIDDIDINDSCNRHICYVDYETKKQQVLCSKQNCTHDTDLCDSYVQNNYFDCTEQVVFTDGKNLFLLVGSKQEDLLVYLGNAEEENIPLETLTGSHPALYRMNMDGSNRELVYDFRDGESVDSKIFYDGKNLIMLLKEVEATKINPDYVYMNAKSMRLITLSLDDFTSNSIMEIDLNSKLIGCTSNYLVFAKDQYKEQYTKEKILLDDMMYQKAKETEQVEIYKVDIASQKRLDVTNIDQKGAKTYTVLGNCLYYGVENTGTLVEMDLHKGTQKQIETKYNSIQGHSDDRLICTDAYHFLGQTQVLLDFASEQETPITILDDDNISFTIVSENSTSYLLQINRREYLLISKTDFNDQKPEFENITNYGQQ